VLSFFDGVVPKDPAAILRPTETFPHRRAVVGERSFL
jgi:hypothetical protein